MPNIAASDDDGFDFDDDAADEFEAVVLPRLGGLFASVMAELDHRCGVPHDRKQILAMIQKRAASPWN